MTFEDFTDAGGNVYLGGKEEPKLRVVGYQHRVPCPVAGAFANSTVHIAGPIECECGGTVLIGWRAWWPLPDEPKPGLLIDMGDDTDPPEECSVGGCSARAIVWTEDVPFCREHGPQVGSDV